MPEPGDLGRGAERALLAASVICLIGAVIAFATGGTVSTGAGDSFRTHTDAVWVLGTSALALFAAAYFVSAERPRL